MTAGDTIVAVATPPGTGGIGVVRVSGPAAASICRAISGSLPAGRQVRLADFRDAAGVVIDHGLVVFFPAPGSYTGEDVVEFQGHGSPVVMEMLLEAAVDYGARPARPGEFSERAFLNGRMDLAQAEAVADLIESSSRRAARLALKSLDGAFSEAVGAVVEELTAIRVFVEASIDFPEEEIDFLADSDVAVRVVALRDSTAQTRAGCQRGAALRHGLNVVLCGPPNAGKSSLLNALAGQERAIVSATPGTTRDIVEAQLRLAGLAIQVRDTAGLRDGADDIESQGIRRARDAIGEADLALVVVDSSTARADDIERLQALVAPTPLVLVMNKIDLGALDAGVEGNIARVSAATGDGIAELERLLVERALGDGGEETLYLARQRHIDALDRAVDHLDRALQHADAGDGELLAEELLLAQRALGELTGELTSDDLLGRVFSSFCIGK